MDDECKHLARIPGTVAGLRALRSRELLGLRAIAMHYGASEAQIGGLLRERFRIRPATLERLRHAFALALEEKKHASKVRA